MSLGCLWCIKAQSSAVWYAWVLWVANIPRACVVNVKTVKLTLFKRFLTDRFGKAAFLDRTSWVGYGRNKAADDEQKENYRLVH